MAGDPFWVSPLTLFMRLVCCDSDPETTPATPQNPLASQPPPHRRSAGSSDSQRYNAARSSPSPRDGVPST